MTIATSHAEVDRNFAEHFDIRHCSNPQLIDDELESTSGVSICFEFDYPDRPGLSLLRSTKERYPKIPVLMLTTHHSERLAVWAYRNRVMDYLVKPVSTEDFLRCRELLRGIQTAENRQSGRTIIGGKPNIPIEIPVGQRTGAIRLAPAVHFVQENFQQQIRNADIAKLCGMSQFHFSHEFAETYSLTFQEFVLRYRILEACRQLRHPNVPVANVAYAVGFNDPSYFARVFRRFVGLSPSEYCEQIKCSDNDQRLQDLLQRLELPELESTYSQLARPRQNAYQ
jgi:AraC-like DNA-binding protein